MYRKCVTDISVEHQRQLEDSLLELMQTIPYEEISVTRICQAAGLSRRIFYHLFNNKAGSLHALLDHRILGIGGYLPQLDDPILQFFLYWKDQQKLLDTLYANDLIGLLLERMITNVLDEDYDLLHWLRGNGWKQEQEVLTFTITGIMALVCRWYYSGYEKSPEDMAQLVSSLVTHPLSGPAIP